MEAGAGTQRQTSALYLPVRCCGPDEDCLVGPLLVKMPQHFLTGEVRQAQVQEHDVVRIAQRDPEALMPAGRLVDGEPG
jgi:hypothetical protein